MWSKLLNCLGIKTCEEKNGDADADIKHSAGKKAEAASTNSVGGRGGLAKKNKAKTRTMHSTRISSPRSNPSSPRYSNISEYLKLPIMDNLNPKLHKKSDARVVTLSDFDESVVDEIDAREVFDMIRDINDPEHPLTLEELNVVEEDKIEVDNTNNYVKISFTPTIPHCSMATLIGLAIRVQLMRSLPTRFKVDIAITPGSHASEFAINKQLADKERVAAALENAQLIEVVNQCLAVKGY